MIGANVSLTFVFCFVTIEAVRNPLMLDQNDVKIIKKVFEESFPVAMDQALEKFAATSLNKSFQDLEDKMATKAELKIVEDKVDRLDAKLGRYPDKAYLDDKLADAVSEIGLRILKRDEKEKNFKLYLIDVLKTHLHIPDDVTGKLRELAEVK